MAVVLQSFVDCYKYLFVTLKDPRAEKYFLVRDSPIPVFSIFVSYILLIKYGPMIMKNFEPFKLKYVMIVYNMLQVVVNTYYGIEGLIFVLQFSEYKCRPVDYSSSELGLLKLFYGNLYFAFKIIDLLDTVFIVLKKNNRQLTFLHCYHHAGMIVFGYIGAKWVPGGPPIMLCLCNTWVHAVMYLYYLLNTFYPKLKNSSWKKYITQIQLLQFAYLTIHFFNCLMSDCGFPRMLLVLCVAQGFGFFFMFAQFYHGAYLKTKTQ